MDTEQSDLELLVIGKSQQNRSQEKPSVNSSQQIKDRHTVHKRPINAIDQLVICDDSPNHKKLRIPRSAVPVHQPPSYSMLPHHILEHHVIAIAPPSPKPPKPIIDDKLEPMLEPMPGSHMRYVIYRFFKHGSLY